MGIHITSFYGSSCANNGKGVVLAADEKRLGPHHPDVAADLLGLGDLLTQQANYADAEKLLRRAAKISERHLAEVTRHQQSDASEADKASAANKAAAS
eukprot:441065-Pyramimonas_sp.AAC.1